MVLKKNVESSNTEFKQLEVDVDTVFTRFNEEEIYDKDGTHIGWIYDEVWEDKDRFIERISKQNKTISKALIETSLMTAEENKKNKQAIVELANLIGGMM